MAEGQRTDTALGVARARFIESLSRKASELRGAVALVAAAPDADKPREEIRRRLHALYASAQVFHIDALTDVLKQALVRIDSARDGRRPLSQEDLDALALVAGRLVVLGGTAPGGSSGRASVPPPAMTPSGRAPAQSPVPVTPPPDSASLVDGDFDFDGDRRSAARGAQALDSILSVLVIDNAENQAQIRAALPAERFEVLSSANPEDALRLARSGTPDVVLADMHTATRDDSDLIGRLRNDPLTDFVPVVLLVRGGEEMDPVVLRALGADDVLQKPFDTEALLRVIQHVTTAPGGAGDLASTSLGDATLEEIADRIAAEVRRGLVETAKSGKELKVPLGDGSPILGAAWQAIARMRGHINQRSGGRVRFRDPPRRGGPALLALAQEEPPAENDQTEVSLRGRRIIVADDDPAVVWFFAGLLRESGADVVEAAGGEEALAHARRRRPDVIISDILMPGMDGFGLCREVQRDPSLADVPVILLSWKEDFLQRMRELESGASGYLRKEAGTAQILAGVQDVLRPRARLEAQLKAGGEVRGRIERMGVVPLLHTVARERPNARVVVRDAWNLFEIDVRRGQLLDVTRTAADGAFARGDAALTQLLGVISGRFAVVENDAVMRGTFNEPLDTLLRRGMARLGARLDAVSGTGLMQVASLKFDEEVIEGVLQTSPERVRKLIERLRAGEGPRRLLLTAEVAPQALESVLVDLARRGALTEVRGPGGEDRVLEALRERQGIPQEIALPPDIVQATPMPSRVPPPRVASVPVPIPRPAGSSLRPPVVDHSKEPTLEIDLGDVDKSREPTLEIEVDPTSGEARPRGAPPPAALKTPVVPSPTPERPLSEPAPLELVRKVESPPKTAEVREPTVEVDISDPQVSLSEKSKDDQTPVAVPIAGARSAPAPRPAASVPAPAPPREAEPAAAPAAAPASAPASASGSAAPSSLKPPPPQLADTAVLSAGAIAATAKGALERKLADTPVAIKTTSLAPPAPAKHEAKPTAPPEAAASPAPAASKPVATASKAGPAPVSPTSASAAHADTSEPAGFPFLILFVLFALAVAGFLFYRMSDEAPGEPVLEGSLRVQGAEEHAAADVSPTIPHVPGEAAALPARAGHMPPFPVLTDLRFGRRVPGLVDPAIPTDDGQGQLRIEADPTGRTTRVLVDDRELPRLPTTVALGEGVHEVAFRQGDQVSYRSLTIRRGESIVVAPAAARADVAPR